MNQINGWIGRRDLLRWAGMGGASMIMAAGAFWKAQPGYASPSPENAPPILNSDAALQRLLDGNQRFVQHRPEYPDQSLSRLRDVAQGQHPFAAILSCADSRVAPELLFDQGLGDIFDVRIAGNVVTPEALGSLEYAIELLATPLLMVLGHERCGAVTAAVKNEPLPGRISTFVKPIRPAVARVKDQPGDPVENAVVANVQYQVERLQHLSPLLRHRANAGILRIVGGRYDLDTGAVTIIA